MVLARGETKIPEQNVKSTKQNRSLRGGYVVFVTAAVLHAKMYPLNEDASRNMHLGWDVSLGLGSALKHHDQAIQVTRSCASNEKAEGDQQSPSHSRGEHLPAMVLIGWWGYTWRARKAEREREHRERVVEQGQRDRQKAREDGLRNPSAAGWRGQGVKILHGRDG